MSRSCMPVNGEPSVFVLGSYVAACSVTVERLPRPGETLKAESFLIEAGGKGLNVAIGLRRLGVDVDGLIAVGDDLLGSLAGTALRMADLPAGMMRNFASRSGAGVGLINSVGETVIAVYPGANQLLSADDIAAAADAIAHAGHIIAQFEIGDAPIAAAFAAAGQAVTVLNPSPFRRIVPSILKHTDMIVVNALEASDLAESLGIVRTPADAPEAEWAPLARKVHDEGVATLVITRGAQDALLWQTGEPLLVQPSFAVACVDGVGAGDAFLSGLVAGLAVGTPISAALREAAACGAMATTRQGVAEALPTMAQLSAFLSSRGH